MATRYAVSGATDWESTASWSSTIGGSSGASVPVDGDDVYILSMVRFAQGLDQDDVTLGVLTIGEGLKGGYIGGASNYLKIGATTAHITAFSPIYLEGGTGVIQTCNVYASPNKNCHLAGNVYDTVLGTDGVVEFAPSNHASLFSTGMGVDCPDTATLKNIGGGAINMYAGSAVIRSPIHTVNLFGRSSMRAIGEGVTVDDLRIYGGARYTHRSNGTISYAEIYTGGRADATGSPYGFTVTDGLRAANSYAWDQEVVPVTFTAPLSRIGYR